MTRQHTLLCAGITAYAALAVWAPAQQTDRDRAELNGPVKAVALRWRANHKDQYGSVEERELGSSSYDAAGNLIVEHEITPDFSRDKQPVRHGQNETLFRSAMGSSVERYRFDARGNMIQLQTWYGERATGAPRITQRFTYDANGRMARRDVLAGDGTGKRLDATFYTRDSSGNVTLEEIRNADRPPPYPRMHYTYEVDTHGNWTAKFVTRENVPEDAFEFRYVGNLFRTITYFDSAGP